MWMHHASTNEWPEAERIKTQIIGLPSQHGCAMRQVAAGHPPINWWVRQCQCPAYPWLKIYVDCQTCPTPKMYENVSTVYLLKCSASSDPHRDIIIMSLFLTHSFWHLIWKYIWHVFFWLSILAVFLTFYSDIPFWHLFWHPIWHPFWHLFWHFLWHSFWHLYLPYLLTVFLAFYLLYLWFLCGWGPAGNTLIREHCYLTLAVEVRRESLWSWACCSGPAGNTAI